MRLSHHPHAHTHPAGEGARHGQRPPAGRDNARSGGLRGTLITAGSIAGGMLAAGGLVVAFSDAGEHAITAALLLGFAFGWALLATLSARLTDRPQRWAAVPAAAMALTGAGLLVLAPATGVLTALGWVWPPLLAALVVWMTRRVRREPLRRGGLWPLYPVLAILALAAVGGAYETLRTATDAATADAAAGRLVDVGGHRLNIRCTGSGSPTVVLEPGLGESSRAMAHWIAPDVARTTRICVYDQAGHGRSEPAPGNHRDAARDLHALLARRGIHAPYVLAGHSLGGAFALSYAHRYPTEVGGLVLLDSMHPRQSNAFTGMDPLLALVPTLARTGIARLLFDAKDGDPEAQARQLVRDIADMPAELDRAAKLTTLGDRPLAVITAGKDYQAGWLAHQDALARLSRNVEHRIVPGSTHASLINDKADAAQSSRAIRDVVRAVRKLGRPSGRTRR
jgi:pimeloyl-ACP methyl ester carboxylesterase